MPIPPNPGFSLRIPAGLAGTFSARNTDTWLKCIGVLLLLAVLASFVLYLRFSFEVYPVVSFNSDDAAALLFSSEVLRQQSLFPDWYNSTGIWLPFTSPKLLLLPILLAVSDHWMASYRTAILLDQILMSALVWWVLGRVGLSRALRLFLLCFLFASVSSQMAEQTVMIAGQDWFYAEMLLLTFLVFRCLNLCERHADDQIRVRLAWVFAVATLLFIDRSKISQMVPPLVAALTVLWMSWAGKRSPKPILMTLGVLVISAVAGELVYHFLLGQVVSYKHIAPTFVDLNAAGSNVLLLVRALMDLFGAAPVVGSNVYSVSSIFWVVKLAVMCVVLLGPLWLLTRWQKIENDFLRLLIVVFAASLALRVLVYVFTGISVGVTATNRYFISVAFIGLTIMLLYFERYWRPLPIRAGALAVAAVFVAGSPLLVARPADGSKYHKIARFLESEHLDHGYATFWNAGVLTALADNRVQVRQVLLGSGNIQPFNWLSSQRWYDGNPQLDESFLLLKGAERKFNLQPLQAVLGEPVRVVNHGDYRAVVYPFDIAERLGWGLSVDQKLPPADRHVSIQTIGSPVWSKPSQCWAITLRVTNLGSVPIGSIGSLPVNLGVHLLSPTGQLLENDYARATLPMIASGKSTVLTFEPPDDRARGNILEFDAVQENVAWFSGPDSHALRVRIPQPPSGESGCGAHHGK